MAERNGYDDGLDDDESSNDSPLVKDLRKQLRAAKRELSEKDEKIVKLEGSTRERSVKDVLNAKGVRPGVAKFLPKELVAEADIVKWLEENAEDLGITLGDTSGDSAPDPSAVDRSRAQALEQRGIAPSKMADLEARLEKAETNEEVDAIMAEARQFVM